MKSSGYEYHSRKCPPQELLPEAGYTEHHEWTEKPVRNAECAIKGFVSFLIKNVSGSLRNNATRLTELSVDPAIDMIHRDMEP